MTRYAILAGLTRLDPAAYDGWDGECPGCDRDVYRVGKLLNERGFDGIEVLVNSAATTRGVLQAFERAGEKLRADDLLVLFYSGHGGQIADTDGDEDEDGKDETLCLWDGEAIDDRIAVYLMMVPKAVRVLFVTDSCNSGTNYRGMKRRKKSTPVKMGSARNTFRGSLLHYGGCSDGRYSYGDWDGGKFTNAMLDVLAKARKPLNYTDLFQRISERMPKYQQPAIGQWGGPAFSDREVMT